MPFELINTSAPKGIDQGSRGFTTVAITQGLDGIWRTRLESLSSYSLEKGIKSKPAIYTHITLTIGGSTRHVLSRVAPSGLDYSGRPNRIAHHVILDQHELLSRGPVSLLQESQFFLEHWNDDPQILNAKQLQDSNVQARSCSYWKQVTGDAGHASHLIRHLFSNSKKPLFIIATEKVDCLQLISETVSLLDPSDRWRATFTTLLQNLSADASCGWQVVIDGTKQAKNLSHRPDVTKINLSDMPPLPEDHVTEAARNGLSLSASRKSGTKLIVPDLPQPALDREDNLQVELEDLQAELGTAVSVESAASVPTIPGSKERSSYLESDEHGKPTVFLKDKQNVLLPWIIAGVAGIVCLILLVILLTSSDKPSSYDPLPLNPEAETKPEPEQERPRL